MELLLLWLYLLLTPELTAERGYRLAQARDYKGAELALSAIAKPIQLHSYNRYVFTKALIAHSQEDKVSALKYIGYLEESFAPIPERYKVVATLMRSDMETWKDKDVGAIARKMANVKDRLASGRANGETQRIQKDIIYRLDELIKKAENDAKGGGDSGEAAQQGSQDGDKSQGKSGEPLPDSQNTKDEAGTGEVAKLRKMITSEAWGRLPPREQARAIQELTQNFSPRHREAIRNYFMNLATQQNKR